MLEPDEGKLSRPVLRGEGSREAPALPGDCGMDTMKQEETGQRTLGLTVEVSGCRHACSFCWAGGHYYPPMDVGDVERILDQAAEFCRSEGLTFEQNLIDLGWHQKEFQRRRSFAYTVVTPSESVVTGCVYIHPTRKRGHGAEIYLWARQSELASGLESRLYAAVKDWVAREWPFKKAAFPGRNIDWDTWRRIPNEKR